MVDTSEIRTAVQVTKVIGELAAKAVAAEDAQQSMHFAQAAFNMAHVRALLKTSR